jgi:hypothetical protein
MRRRIAICGLGVAAILFLAGAREALAQGEKLRETTPEQRAQYQTDFMKSKLNLTPEQTTKVSDINLKYAKRMDPVIKSSEGSLVRMRQARAINAEKDTELKGVLTPDQWQKLEAAREEMRQKFEEGKGLSK